jgi:DNA-binding HxlR family transcriptional regulator
MPIPCHTGAHSDHDVYRELCPCRDVLDLIANKWTALAIGALEAGPLRFGELQRRLAGVTPKVLSTTLKRLETNELVTRTVIPEVPLHVKYELTPLGHSLSTPLRGIREWTERHLDDLPIGQTHDATGS